MAEKEYKKIKSQKKYRSSFNTLKRLSKSNVFMPVDDKRMDEWQDLSLMNLGYVVTKYIGRNYNGDRKLAVKKSITKLEKSINLKGWMKWSAAEITALERMAPLIVNIRNLSTWSKAEKKQLIEIIKAKGSKREKKYVELSIKHPKYQSSLQKLAG